MTLNETNTAMLSYRINEVSSKLQAILERPYNGIYTYELETGEAANRVAANRWSKAEINRFASWISFKMGDMTDLSWISGTRDNAFSALLIEWVVWEKPRQRRAS